jgi:3-polyprenyl-4-hydroxybenzoate decarboxylase
VPAVVVGGGEVGRRTAPHAHASFAARQNRRASVSAESMTPSSETHESVQKIVIPKSDDAMTRIAAATKANLLFRNLEVEQLKGAPPFVGWRDGDQVLQRSE